MEAMEPLPTDLFQNLSAEELVEASPDSVNSCRPASLWGGRGAGGGGGSFLVDFARP